MKRRRFTNVIGLATLGLGLGLPLVGGCKKDPVSSDDGKSSMKLHSDEHGDFETLEGKIENNSLTFESKILGSRITVHSSIDNVDVHAYCDVDGNVLVSGFKNGFLPAFVNGDSELDISLDLILQLLSAANDIGDIYADFSKNAPTFNSEDSVLKIPGIEYVGNYSFNQINSLTDLLNDSVSVLVPVFPGIAPISIATNILNSVADGIDYLIDFMNENGLNIDKNMEFEFYRIPWLNVEFFIPPLIKGTDYSRNIKDYLRINQGDWWLYDTGRGDIGVEVRGYKRIRGKQIPIFEQTDGLIAYQGFDGKSFYTFGMGFNDQEVIFDVPIKCGDDRLAAGRVYKTNLVINGEEVLTEYEYQRIENPFGLHDTYQFPDSWKFTMDNDLAFISRGIGQTRIKQNGLDVRIKDWGSGVPPWRRSLGGCSRNISPIFIAGIGSNEINEQFYKSLLSTS
jgi:hypothetical protein